MPQSNSENTEFDLEGVGGVDPVEPLPVHDDSASGPSEAPMPQSSPLVKKPVVPTEQLIEDLPDDEEEEESSEDSDRRNYEDFSDDQQVVLRKLPNKLFNKASEIFTSLNEKIKQLESVEGEYQTWKREPGRLPEAYFEHPQAYQLSPEFAKVQSDYSRASTEAEFYHGQIAAIDAGETTIQIITGWRNGQPVYDNYNVQPDTKYKLQDMATQARVIAGQLQVRAESIQRTFASNYQQSIKAVNDGAQPHFDALRADLKPKPAQIDAFKKIIPPHFHNSPLFDLAAKMFAVIMNQGEAMTKGMTSQKSKVLAANDKELAGPRAKVRSAANGKQSDMIDFEEIEREFR